MTIFTRIEGSRLTRLRRAGRIHAMYLALCAVLTVGCAAWTLAFYLSEAGWLVALSALMTTGSIWQAIHQASEVFRHADLLAKEIEHVPS